MSAGETLAESALDTDADERCVAELFNLQIIASAHVSYDK